MFKRSHRIEALLKWKDRDVIKVLTGIRRCGKSTLMAMVRDRLMKDGVSETRIAFIDFESREGRSLHTLDDVWRHLDQRLSGQGKKYVFLDEVQNLGRFEELVDALYADKTYDIYLTGSNAWMLSGDLATYLSGRHIEIHVQPLSFEEYMEDNSAKDVAKAFLDYSRYGSFPYVRRLVEMGAASDVGDYLEGIFNTVLMKDVAMRTKMTDVGTLRRIACYMFDNISNLTSVKRISDVLSSAGGKASYHAVDAYVESLCRAFLFYRCDRVNVKGLELLKSGSKYYASDIGLRYHLNGNRPGDSGRVLENIVYLELTRRSRHVFSGRTRSGKEIDFITRDGDKITYYQVAETVKDPETLKRELAPLAELSDNYPKFLVCADYGNEVMHNGIRQVNVVDFLLDSHMALV